MFFRERAMQAEYFDSPDRTANEIAEAYGALGKLNRATMHADPFQRLMTRFIGRKNCQCFEFGQPLVFCLLRSKRGTNEETLDSVNHTAHRSTRLLSLYLSLEQPRTDALQ